MGPVSVERFCLRATCGQAAAGDPDGESVRSSVRSIWVACTCTWPLAPTCRSSNLAYAPCNDSGPLKRNESRWTVSSSEAATGAALPRRDSHLRMEIYFYGSAQVVTYVVEGRRRKGGRSEILLQVEYLFVDFLINLLFSTICNDCNSNDTI